MSNSSAHSQNSARSSRLLKWINRTVSQPEMRVGYRLRGNTLHLLYEGNPCPNQQVIIRNVLAVLSKTDGAALLPDSVQIYQIWLYGRRPRKASSHASFSEKLDWTFRINLDQLEELKQQFAVSSSAETSSVNSPSDSVSTAASSSAALPLPDASTSNVLIASDRGDRPAPSTAASSTNDEIVRLDAIACELSETLNRLGVSVSVAAKAQSSRPSKRSTTSSRMATVSFPHRSDDATARLWISCRAHYSPSPSLIAEPIARQLRLLNLDDFRDAVVTVRVAGEDKPDWTLRIDLTPANVLMRAWARWGDVAALSRLLEQTLNHEGWTLQTATLKEATLHLVCQPDKSLSRRTELDPESSPAESGPVTPSTGEAGCGDAFGDNPRQSNLSPPKTSASNTSDLPSLASAAAIETSAKSPSWHSTAVKRSVQALLDELAPQGIHAAMLYGQQPGAEKPVWVEWLPLPASTDFSRSTAALELAQNGHLEAIAFLISRLLNPDLDTQVATGGIRIQVLPRDELLHVMCDALVCPPQDSICDKVVQLLRQIKAPHINGVRIYGRRSGLRSPLWSYGTDFVTRQRFVPQPEPEFAATSAYVSELITHRDESPLRPDLTARELKTRWSIWSRRWGHKIQRSLLNTQLVTPTADTPLLAIPQTINRQGIKTAIIWAAVGLLSVVQIDWLMGITAQNVADAEARQDELVQPPPAATPQPEDNQALPEPAASASEETSPQTDRPFTSDELIHSANDNVSSPDPSVLSISQVNSETAADSTQDVLIEDSPYPSFNSRQLDLKLALYHQRIAEQGVPEVLVIGSSRALRGVDPVVLEKSLAELGYTDADIFNFGINGATAQVVDLVIQRILVPEQLPQMIIWADGARAFNGGREDLTYSGIATSEGYDLLTQGKLSVPVTTPEGVIDTEPSSSTQDSQPSSLTAAFSASLADSYQALDEWLSDRLADVSLAHDQRDRLKSMIQETLTAEWLPSSPSNPQARDANSEAEAIHPAAMANGNNDPLEGDRILGQIDQDGFLPLDVRFDPVTYYDRFARVPGNYDKDYADFRLTGSQTTALESILSMSRQHSVPVVFVNLPLTEEYLDPHRMNYEAEFRQFMLEVDLAHDSFIFRDLSTLWLDQEDYYEYFSDPSHLNRYGAFEVSKRLAQDPMIPWLDSSVDSSSQP